MPRLTSIPATDAWQRSLTQPFGDSITWDAPPPSPEIDTTLRLPRDLSTLHSPTRRLTLDARANPAAFAHLATMPAQGESLHGVISGRYALYELIPALIERTQQPIAALYIATLSFNKQNAADILALLQAGHVKSLALIISYYFKSTSREIYDLLIPPLRAAGQRVLAIRNHAKLLLAEMANGQKFTVETSANLRSSGNIEQFVLTADGPLHDFHRGWIEDLFATRKDMGTA